uniref:Winged helix-turn-helix domain protein n=1 Tax=Clandestinovirus TaxID=2831644 RepID=A0A8F8KTH9_9VIRU|nr:winged helix-turn-helix domain protein [Clandestinovirus]
MQQSFLDDATLGRFDEVYLQGNFTTSKIAEMLGMTPKLVRHLRLPWCAYKIRQSKQFTSIRSVDASKLATFIRTIPGIHFNVKHDEIARNITQDRFLTEYVHTRSIYQEYTSFADFYNGWQESVGTANVHDMMVEAPAAISVACNESEMEAAALLSSIANSHDVTQGSSVATCNESHTTYIARLAVVVNGCNSIVFPYTYNRYTTVQDLINSMVRMGNHPIKFSYLCKGIEVIPMPDQKIVSLSGTAKVPVYNHQSGLWNNLPVFNIYLSKP